MANEIEIRAGNGASGSLLLNADFRPLAVSVQRARQHLGGVSIATVYRMIERGELEKRKVGSRTVITMASIEAALGIG